MSFEGDLRNPADNDDLLAAWGPHRFEEPLEGQGQEESDVVASILKAVTEESEKRKMETEAERRQGKVEAMQRCAKFAMFSPVMSASSQEEDEEEDSDIDSNSSSSSKE